MKTKDIKVLLGLAKLAYAHGDICAPAKCPADVEEAIIRTEGFLDKQPDNLEVCAYIPISELAPEEFWAEYWGALSDDAPFSWGDNNRTMVTGERVGDHCERVLNMEHDIVRKFVERIRDYDDVYIDLEN